MERHDEIRSELHALYAKSANTTDAQSVKETERKIDLLEQEAATLLHCSKTWVKITA